MEKQRLVTEPFLSAQRPIEYLTENGFSIVRLTDIDKSIPAVGASHHFLVRDPYGYELHITVEITNDAAEQVAASCRGRISNDSSYWICFAERHLATYLWENDDYPPDALNIDQSKIEDLDLARRWDRQA
ncbi:MAG: hypothetical protein AABM67_14430 [Acidobacteriota bacterium]